MKKTLQPSEAVYGFAAWLSGRDIPIVLGSRSDTAEIAELAIQFCEANDLSNPRENWHHCLRMPTNKVNNMKGEFTIMKGGKPEDFDVESGQVVASGKVNVAAASKPSKKEAPETMPRIDRISDVVIYRMRLFIQKRQPFTSVDIANDLKIEGYPWRNRDIASEIRKNFQVLCHDKGYAWEATLITVDSKAVGRTQTYLYHPSGYDTTRYLDRDQSPVPPPPTPPMAA